MAVSSGFPRGTVLPHAAAAVLLVLVSLASAAAPLAPPFLPTTTPSAPPSSPPPPITPQLPATQGPLITEPPSAPAPSAPAPSAPAPSAPAPLAPAPSAPSPSAPAPSAPAPSAPAPSAPAPSAPAPSAPAPSAPAPSAPAPSAPPLLAPALPAPAPSAPTPSAPTPSAPTPSIQSPILYNNTVNQINITNSTSSPHISVSSTEDRVVPSNLDTSLVEDQHVSNVAREKADTAIKSSVEASLVGRSEDEMIEDNNTASSPKCSAITSQSELINAANVSVPTQVKPILLSSNSTNTSSLFALLSNKLDVTDANESRSTNDTKSNSTKALENEGKKTPSGPRGDPFTNACTGEGSKRVAPYGSWPSPVSSEVAVTVRHKIVEGPRVDPVTGHVFWVEEVTDEEGRGVVYQHNVDTGSITRWSAHGVDVRSRVHEYGGGALLVHNDTLYYIDGGDNQVYRQRGSGGTPEKLTDNPLKRYADGTYAPQMGVLYYVCEDHSADADESGYSSSPKNSIVSLDTTTLKMRAMLSHGDFFAAPRVTEDGRKLVWMQWNQPQMPWDSTKLYVGQIAEGTGDLSYHQFFQQGSIIMPSWNRDQELLYIHDSTGWWNLYIVARNGTELPLTPHPVEVGWPVWRLGEQAYDTSPAVGAHEAVAIVGKKLHVIDTLTGKGRQLDTGYASHSLGVAYGRGGSKVYTVAGTSTLFPTLLEVDLTTGSSRPLLDNSSPVPLEYISTPHLIQYPTTDGYFSYGHLYMPKNPQYTASLTARPPLLVRAHPGPHDAAITTLQLTIQYFTTRGFAVLDVDYRGSSGYGKYYRDLLALEWGDYDLWDVVLGARQLVQNDVVNPHQLFIDGASAGGFTTLAALTAVKDFTAGASFYGISDLAQLASTAHKFESQYLTSLVGDPVGDADRYRARSPYYHADNITTPVIFFHGVDDKVVPVDQAEKLHGALKSRGILTAFLRLEGEEHFFHRLSSLTRALDAELVFFAKVANITLADVTSDVVIDNLAN